jgi:hypothetical protein
MKTCFALLSFCILMQLSMLADSTLVLPAGLSGIANQVNNGGNTLAEILPVVPDHTQLLVWNCPTASYITYQFAHGIWNSPTTKLLPGQGAFINLPIAASITFVGSPYVPVLPLSLPCGCGTNVLNLIGRQTNGIGTYENITGYAPQDGAQVQRWNGSAFVPYTYSSGSGWSPSVPILNIGEGAYFSVPCPTTPCLSIQCSNIVLSSCTNVVVTYSPAVTDLCASNFTVVCTPPSGTSFPPGTTPVHCVVTDTNDASATCDFTVTVLPFDFECPTNIVVTSCTNIAVFYSATITNDCCSNVVVEFSPPSGTLFTPGTTTPVFCQVFDFCNPGTNGPPGTNRSGPVSTSCYFTVTVIQDTNTPPVLICATNKTIDCDVPWDFDAPTVSDSCLNANVIVSILMTMTNGTGPQLITRTWQATDTWGNTATCSQTVTILTNCCYLLSNESVYCNSNGTYTYSFDIRNDSGQVISYLVLEDTNGVSVFNPPVISLNPPMQTNETRHESVTLTAACGPLCFYISLHTSDWAECCSHLHCISVPDCCVTPHVYSSSIDFSNGVLLNLTNDNGVLHFPAHITPFPFYNISCSARGTMDRIDVNTGTILSEFKTAPESDYPSSSGNPSRVCVDLFGNIWVANRNDTGTRFGTNGATVQGSVTRYALIIGGTRGDKYLGADGHYHVSPNPNGEYLEPPFIYNSGAVDRDGDGLIKTSHGLGDILAWKGAEAGDGTVTNADDECIINYIVSAPTGTRTLAVDTNGDMWIGGINNNVHEKIDSVLGKAVPGSAFTGAGLAGGYGGLIDGNNVLWSARGRSQDLLRVPLPPGCSSSCGTDLGNANGDYGLGIDPCTGIVWHSTFSGANKIYPWSPAGISLNPSGYSELSPGRVAQGVVVDDSGNVWVAHTLGGNTVGHLKTSGAAVGVITLPGASFNGPTGVAADSNGKIWVSCFQSSQAMRIDPTLAGGVGAVDLVVDLNAAGGRPADPYNYSDNTGYVGIGTTSPSGFWDVINDSCSDGADWGKITWLTCTNTQIKVEVRAADKILDLPRKPFHTVSNGVSFCGTGITGRHLEIRVRLFRGVNCGPSPACLQGLTVQCCHSVSNWGTNGPPVVVPQFPPVSVTNISPFITNLVFNITNFGGFPMNGRWDINHVPVQTNQIPGGPAPTFNTVSLTYSYPSGSNYVTFTVSDGFNDPVTASTWVTVGDINPPVWGLLPGYVTNAFVGVVPNIVANVNSNQLSDDWTPFGQIGLTQNPPAGATETQGTYMVNLVATDLAGNQSTNVTPFHVGSVLSVVSPEEYATYFTTSTVPVVVQIVSNVTDVARVNYYLDTNLVATSSNTPFSLNFSYAVPGTYTFVAEAVDGSGHTSRPEEADPITFVSTQAPSIQIVQTTNNIILFFPYGWTLQGATNLLGPWNDVPGASTVYTVTNNLPQQFFRTRH